MVIRDNKLNYMMSNQVQEGGKIDLFSELIEGELKEYDEVLCLGTQVDTYIDSSDFTTIREVSKQEEKSFLQGLIDLLAVRVDTEQL